MKKLFYILITLALLGCQNIPDDKQLQPIDWSKIHKQRNVLLVEYTGFTCVNCPLAAEEAHNLQSACGEELVVVAMHPESNAFTNTTKEEYNYTCPEADVYYKFCGGLPTTPFPAGTINFQTQDGADRFTDYKLWASSILRAFLMPAEANIDLQATWENNEQLLVNLNVSAISEPKLAQILLWITEDNVIGPQKMPDLTTNREYVHNHILRGELLSADGMGKQVTLQPGMVTELTFLCNLPAKVRNVKNCHLVAVVLDSSTKEVLQVEQMALANIGF